MNIHIRKEIYIKSEDRRTNGFGNTEDFRIKISAKLHLKRKVGNELEKLRYKEFSRYKKQSINGIK